MNGKTIRLGRLINPVSSRSVFLPIDHGVTVGPIQGIAKVHDSLRRVRKGDSAIQGVVVHRGVASKCCTPNWQLAAPLILHLSASTRLGRDATHKVLVASVEEAVAMGADAVSIHVNLGADAEPAMLRDFGIVAASCDRWGMPLLAMMYTYVDGQGTRDTTRIAHAARLAAELGADFVKVNYPGSIEAMADVTAGCFIPVLVAGGEHAHLDTDVLQMAADAIAGGAGGLCIGRNVFQRADPEIFLSRLASIVHDCSMSDSTRVDRGAAPAERRALQEVPCLT